MMDRSAVSVLHVSIAALMYDIKSKTANWC